jgi:signal transduction histidine kinase
VSRYLARAVAAFVAVVLIVLIAPIAWLSTRLVRTELRERADREATVIAAAITATGLERAEATAMQLPQDDLARTLIVEAAGELIADTDPSGPAPALPTMSAVVDGAPLPDTPDGGIRAAAPIFSSGAVVGAAIVVISPMQVTDRTRGIGLLLAGVGVVVVVTAAGFGAALARSMVRPVEALDVQAMSLAAGEFDARVAVPPRPPELHRLATSFNDMAQRLDAVLTAQRAFTSDAAHQFRTPLTVLRLRLEALQDRIPDDADVEAATREITHLHRLIDDLLALTRLERGTSADTATIALGPAVYEHCQTWSALTEEHGVTLRTRTPREGPHVRVLQLAVEQILDNYLENALRVAPTGSTIDVTVTRRDGRAQLRVADRGPGLDDEQRLRAFDRFWRGAHAPRDGGTGLGLSIVARLAAAAGGTARLEPRTGGGTVAVAEFPTRDSPVTDPS